MNGLDYATYWAEVTVATGAALTALYAGGKAVYKLAKRVEHLVEKVEKIDAALGPNGGSSIRDAIDRIEANQHQHIARLRAVADVDDAGTFETDELGGNLWVNRAYCRIAGISQQDALRHGWMTAVDPADRDRVAHEWEEAVRQRRDFDIPCFRLAKDRSCASIRAVCIVDKLGTVTNYVGFLREKEGCAECRH